MLYESLTYWRAGTWLVLVQAHLTANKASAEAFGRIPMRLTRHDDRLALVVAHTGTELGEAYDDNITVYQLRDGADLILPIDLETYQEVELRIDQFGQHPELEQLICVEHGTHEFTVMHLPAWSYERNEDTTTNPNHQ